MKPFLVMLLAVGALIAMGDRGPSTPEKPRADDRAPVPAPPPAPPPAESPPVGAGLPAAPPRATIPPIPPNIPTAPPPAEGGQARPAARPAGPGLLIQSIADGFHGLTEIVDGAAQGAFGFGDEEERRMAGPLYREVLTRERVWEDPRALRRVRDLARPLLNRRSRKGIDYSVTLLDKDDLNAFSIAGGSVFLNRGLVGLAKDDVELQFVLGHEIAHIDLGHCARQFTYRSRARKVGGEAADVVIGVTYHAVALGFSEDHELESDAWSYRTLISLGRSHDQAMAFLRRLQEELRRSAADRPARPDRDGGELGRVLNDHFASHPPISLRIARLEELRARVPKAPSAAAAPGGLRNP